MKLPCGLELLGELGALVLEAVGLDHRRDLAEAGVGGVDPHGVEALQEELERLAEGAGPLHVGRTLHRLAHRHPLGGGLQDARSGLEL